MTEDKGLKDLTIETSLDQAGSLRREAMGDGTKLRDVSRTENLPEQSQIVAKLTNSHRGHQPTHFERVVGKVAQVPLVPSCVELSIEPLASMRIDADCRLMT